MQGSARLPLAAGFGTQSAVLGLLMAKLSHPLSLVITSLLLGACTHEQPPPAAPVTEPSSATESAPAEAPSPPPATPAEKKSNDASGSTSPLPEP